MKLSLIIPCYNAADTIGNQLEALCHQRWFGAWEVIIADNGSTDGSRAVIERYKNRLPSLRVVEASQRRGPAYATNTGARAATGDALLFCDADDEVGPGWLEAMGQALLENDFVACGLDAEKLNEAWLRESRSHTQRNALQRLPYPPHLPHAGGSTLGVKRRLFETVGGFDEELVATQDTFFCVQVQLAGAPLHFVPNATVHTRYRDTFPGMYRQARTYGQYSTLTYKKALALGTPRISHPWREAAKNWWILFKRVLQIRWRGDLAWCVFRFGYQVGRLRGSIKYRILAF